MLLRELSELMSCAVLSSGRGLRLAMARKFSKYKTRIWAMMLRNFRPNGFNGRLGCRPPYG
jgi:hypothetical protein